MIPFIAAGFIAVILTPLLSGTYVSDKKFEKIIDEQDYNAHLIYQKTFSTRQMGTSLYGFSDFKYDEDGFPVPQKASGENNSINLSEFPPFPLKHLMNFFQDVNNGEEISDYGSTGTMAEKLSLFILLLFIIPCFIIKGQKNMQSIEFSGIKNISGKHRFAGINRNLSHGFYGKNPSRIRKDA
jgi:hypothetical protein